MSNIPKIKFQKSASEDQLKLTQWLHDWQLKKALEEDGADTGAVEEEPVALNPALQDIPVTDENLPNEAKEEIRAGDIRILQPSICPTELPSTVLVLAEWPREDTAHPGVKRWVVCFFSPMAYPALRSEWKTNYSIPLATLSLWNSRILDSDFLGNSWKIDQIAEEERSAALDVYKSWALQRELPAHHLERVGPPLVHPEDPRHEYLQRECERVQPIDDCYRESQERAQQEHESKVIPTMAQDFAFEHPSAAGSSEHYSRVAIADEGAFLDRLHKSDETEAGKGHNMPPKQEECMLATTDGPSQSLDNYDHGYILWKLSQPVRNVIRVLVVDIAESCLIGEGVIQEDGKTVGLQKINWSQLEAYVEKPARLKDLVLLLITNDSASHE